MSFVEAVWCTVYLDDEVVTDRQDAMLDSDVACVLVQLPEADDAALERTMWSSVVSEGHGAVPHDLHHGAIAELEVAAHHFIQLHKRCALARHMVRRLCVQVLDGVNGVGVAPWQNLRLFLVE